MHSSKQGILTMKKTILGLILPLFILIFASTTQAATLRPNITTDPTVNPLEDDQNCSLRYAIQAIQTMDDFAGCSNETPGEPYGTNDTIILDAQTYTLTLAGNSSDNETGDLHLDSRPSLTLQGAGMDQTVIDASGISDGDRILDLDQVNTVVISGLEMTGGDVSTLAQEGGAIRALESNITLQDVRLFQNQSNNGGGIFTLSCVVNINNSVIESNEILDADFPLAGGGASFLEPDGCPETPMVTINDSWVIGNMALPQGAIGGGIALDGDTALWINNSTIDGNMSEECGGGLFNGLGTFVNITYSTISRNTSTQAGGGGICDFGAYSFLTNTTVSSNTTLDNGGGIQSQGGLKGMYNVTIAFNQVTGTDNFAGGVQRNENSDDPRFDIQVFNTIIAQNTADNRPDCEGGFGSGGYNLIGNNGEGDPGECDGFGAMGDQVGTPGAPIDAQLLPLGFNGGPTETHALSLAPLSPAIDMGNDQTGCRALDVPNFFDTDVLNFVDLLDDQRMFVRPIGILDPNVPRCDIGAFELQRFVLEVTKDDGLGGASVAVNDTITYTVTVTNNGPGVAGAVTLSDPLPPEVSFVSATPSQGTCSQAAGTVSCDLGDLNVGAAANVTIVVTAVSEGDALNTAIASAGGESFEASVTTPITGAGPGGLFVFGSGCSVGGTGAPAAALAWALMAGLALGLWMSLRRGVRS